MSLINKTQVNPEFSVVIPLYKCSATIEELCTRLINVFEKLNKSFEIILVNDASPENDWEIASNLSDSYKSIRSINFSRNFGQHYAITAGLENAKGNWIVVMDGDLQDQPEEIENLYNKTKEGFDIVLAKRYQRKDTFYKKMTSIIFYKTFGYLTDSEYDSTVANFGIYKQTVIESLMQMKDKIRVFPILIQWVGFHKASINVKHEKRKQGESSYSYKKLFELAFDIIISFSNKPLKLTIRLGFLITFFSFLVGILYGYRYFNGEILVEGYTSLIVSIWFLSGVIISSVGVLGLYIGKIFNGIKDRPYYVIKEMKN